MDLGRILRHLLTTGFAVRRAFPARALEAIEAAIRAGEARHPGEIRFAVEGSLDMLSLLRGLSARERAIQVFAELGVWDTERNNGVLIYVLLADHDVEIVADRGIDRRVGKAGWEAVCRDMERAFREGRFEAGAIDGIRAVSALLERHFPAAPINPNELPDRPELL